MGSRYRGLSFFAMRGTSQDEEPYGYDNEVNIVAFTLEEALAVYKGMFKTDPLNVNRYTEPLIVVIPEDIDGEA